MPTIPQDLSCKTRRKVPATKALASFIASSILEEFNLGTKNT